MIARRELMLGTLVTVAFARTARGAELDDVLAQIAKARSGLKTLVGPFSQSRRIGLLASEIKSHGTMTLVRPDRLRWELAAPDEITYWVGPEGLAYKGKNGQGRAQGMTAKVAAALADLRVLLGGDLGELRSRYDLKMLPTSDGTRAFEATPRAGEAGAARLKRVAFVLSSDLVAPLRATLVEGPKDKTEIVFGALEKNVAVDLARVKPPF
jgi:outer membrane lipoprotein-sorting protein